MKNIVAVLFTLLVFTACNQSGSGYIVPKSSGNTNRILVVTKGIDWEGEIGDAMRSLFGQHQIGLPQPETILSVTQVDPVGFEGFMRHGKAVLVINKGSKEEGITVERNKYAMPQIIVYANAKNEEGIIRILQDRGQEIIKIFQEEDIKFIQSIFRKESLENSSLKTLTNLGISLDIPDRFNLVDDTGDFLWLRQHLKSGIAKGDGTNNILVYSVPFDGKVNIVNSIAGTRDSIGKKYIPGSKEGMYMITEQAYTPFTINTTIAGKKAFETRGKWEVKNDFMAGPFLNYTIVDKENNRLIVFEGFTYAPSVSKRDFIFELEAIGKSMKIK